VFRAADFVGPQAQARGVRIARTAAADEPGVPCETELIYQVAINLLVNSIQALEHGGDVEVRILPARDGYGGFEVRDDGPGIPAELRERIFQPFVTARPGGVGLGLTFVKRVVHDHRGRISVESEPGSGTCFRIELPLAEAGR
jgi:signal transduction histidine kinase